MLSALNGAVDNLEIGNDTAVAVEDRIENECLKWSFGVARRCGNAFHHGAEDIVDALSCLSRGTDDFRAVAPKEFHNLVLHLFRHGVRHVALVDDGNDFQVMVDGHIKV